MVAIPVSGDAAARVGRRAGALERRDPATGYRRRQLTGPSFPAEAAEVRLPPGARVPYPGRGLRVHPVVWVPDGRLAFHEGDTVYELDAGDTIERGEPVPCIFAKNSAAECRFAVILTRGERP